MIYLSSPITPRKHKTKYKGNIPIKALTIIPVHVGSFLGPFIRIVTTLITSIIKMIASMRLLAIISIGRPKVPNLLLFVLSTSVVTQPVH